MRALWRAFTDHLWRTRGNADMSLSLMDALPDRMHGLILATGDPLRFPPRRWRHLGDRYDSRLTRRVVGGAP